jgi:hypothetical protein
MIYFRRGRGLTFGSFAMGRFIARPVVGGHFALLALPKGGLQG